jgi:hypothetical protein
MKTAHIIEYNETDESLLSQIVVNLRVWKDYLLNKSWLILLAAVIGGVLGFTYAYMKKPVYTATTTFVLEESTPGGLGNLGGLASLIGVDISAGGGGLFSGDNIIELYKSRSMIQKTLLSKANFDGSETLLIDRYIQFNNLKKAWKETNWSLVNFADQNKHSLIQDSVMGEIVQDINERNLSVVKPDKKLSIIRVDVNSMDQLFAKAFADIIVDEVKRFYIETKTKRSLDNVNILQYKTDSVRNVMNGAINRAAAVSDATPNLNFSRQAQRTAPIQRSQFSAETNKAVLSELVKNLEVSKINLLKETPLVQTIDEPILPLDKREASKLIYSLLGVFVAVLLTSLYLVFSKLLSSI